MPSQPYIGEIMPVGFGFAPRSWSTCEGQLLSINSNQALFSLLGTIYGGDGRTTFGLPDLRGRSIVGDGTGPGLDFIRVGQKAGSITHTNTNATMANHSHTTSIQVSTENGEESNSNGQIVASHTDAFNEDQSSGATLGGVNSLARGGNQSYNIRNPFLGMYYCICLFGIYPSRN